MEIIEELIKSLDSMPMVSSKVIQKKQLFLDILT
jgi:hypothetical protein